jgi:hypothetical protein
MNTWTKKSLMLLVIITIGITSSYANDNVNSLSVLVTKDTNDILIIKAGIPYTLGDNDTKSQGRYFAIKEAKIRAAELSGRNISIIKNLENNKILEASIAQLSSDIMLSSIINERYYIVGHNMGVYLDVELEIDKKTVIKKFEKINDTKILKENFSISVEKNRKLLDDLKWLDKEILVTVLLPSDQQITEKRKLLNSIYSSNFTYEIDANVQITDKSSKRTVEQQTRDDLISIEGIKHALSNIVIKLVPSEVIYTFNEKDSTFDIEVSLEFEPNHEKIQHKYSGEEDGYGLKDLYLKGFNVSYQPTIKLTANDIANGTKGIKDHQVIYTVKKRKSKITPRTKAIVAKLDKIQATIELMIGGYSTTLNLTKHNIDNLSFQFKGREQVKIENVPKEIVEKYSLTTRSLLYDRSTGKSE